MSENAGVLPVDPDVLRKLAALPTRESGERPARGDVATRRRNARAMDQDLCASRPPITSVDVRRHELTAEDGATLALTWYHRAHAGAPGGAVLYLHGGGMIYGLDELGQLYDWAVRTYVAAAAVPILVVDYRRAPEHPHPTPVEDCYAALLWLSAHAGELGVDAARLAVMGDSAGGGLAAALCLLARDRGGPQIAQQLLLAPMLDDRTAFANPDIVPFLTWTQDDNATGWSALLGDAVGHDDVPHDAAPARANDLRGLPPAYIDVGDLDIFVGESVGYAGRLTEAGVRTELHVHPGCPHVFELLAPAAPVSRRVIADRVRRLRSLTA